MNDQITLLVLAAVVILAIGIYLVLPSTKRRRDQKRTDRRRKLAHAGKVHCETPGCEDMATRYTPNGYFCEWDYEPMTKKMMPNGKFVTWNHQLYWAVRRS